ncbi:MAG: HlyD family efflux transporter periplasmic adaptor subunit [Opitutales bacterium]|nr:HlyD family efflux transporter periplasmic adaptor subunit [Opitutales bacterium]
MSKSKERKIPSKISMILAGIVLVAVAFQFTREQFKRDAVVSSVEKGSIRDSVSGNLKVLPTLSFQLRSETQSKVKYAALIPFGKPIKVDVNQTLYLMDTTDLDRVLERTLLSQSSHQKRLKTGSSIELQLKLEEQNLHALQTLFEENGKDVSEFEFESKKNLVERLRRQYDFETINNDETSRAFTLEIDRIQEELKKRKIVSPIKGMLISSLVKKGDTIFSGQVMGEVQSNDRIIEVTLNEEDFAGIKEGQKVGVTIFSFGNEILEGVVSTLSANVNSANGHRKLFVELDSNNTLPVGSSGRAEIIKQEIQDTLIIPRKALLGSSVFAVRDGKALQVKVETGARNLEYVEIKKGLKANDLVISETPHLFYDGEQVTYILIE